MYEKMIEYVKNHLNKNVSKSEKEAPFRDNFDHTMRVYEWARRINAVEKADTQVVEVAAIFHDVGKGIGRDESHAETSADICKKYLKDRDFNKQIIERVVRCVKVHSSKEIPAHELGLEERVLMDADLLDEVGALCVLWEGMIQGTKEKPSYYKAYDNLVDHYQKREEELGLLKTGEGKRLYEERLAFLKLYIENLKYELGL